MTASLVDTKSQSLLTGVKHSSTMLSMNKADKLYEESQRRIKHEQQLKGAKRGDWPIIILILSAFAIVGLAVYVPKMVHDYQERQRYNQVIEDRDAR